MKKTVAALLAAALLGAFAAASSPAGQAPAVSGKDALDVLAKMIEALGGRKVLESIKDATITAEVEVDAAGQALKAPVTMYQKEPDKIRLDITIAEYNMSYVQVFDGRKGWFTDPQTGATEEMPGDMARQLARQAMGNRALLDPKGTGVVYALKPKATVEGRDYIVLEQAYPDGHRFTHYLDPETYLPYKSETRAVDMAGTEVEAETFSEDYRKVGGTMLAHSLRVFHNGIEAHKLTITSVAYDTNLDDALFVLK